MKKSTIITLSLALVAILFIWRGYNSMQNKDEAVIQTIGDVQASLQRRLDLIPNLVETVKGYATHEANTLMAVTEARSRATAIQLTPETLNNPQAMEKFHQAQKELDSALSRLMVVVEKYPDLKASQNFRDLQHQIEGTENRINVARQRFNKAVAEYNYSIRSFPNNMINMIFLHLERHATFQADEAASKAPSVKF